MPHATQVHFRRSHIPAAVSEVEIYESEVTEISVWTWIGWIAVQPHSWMSIMNRSLRRSLTTPWGKVMSVMIEINFSAVIGFGFVVLQDAASRISARTVWQRQSCIGCGNLIGPSSPHDPLGY